MAIQDLLSAIAVVLNGLPQGILAMSFGFAALPTALAFVVGGAGMLLFGSVVPISFQAETIVLAGTLGEDHTSCLNIVFYSGVAMAVIGGIGLLEPTINFIGQTILHGLLAGVGIMLARQAVKMLREKRYVGGISFVVAIVTYLLTKDLVYTIVLSVVAGTIYFVVKNKFFEESGDAIEENEIDTSREKFKLLNFKFNKNIVRTTLGVIALQIGGNISYGTITGNIAGTSVNVDHLTLYSGIGSAVSGLFGGGPVNTIISGTAAAPNPLLAGVLMSGIMAVILLLRLLPKIGKYVPSQSIGGFLFVLGVFVAFPGNIQTALEGGKMVGGVTALVTAFSDPFTGMLSGLGVKFILGGFF